jgi:hypothetical protein
LTLYLPKLLPTARACQIYTEKGLKFPNRFSIDIQHFFFTQYLNLPLRISIEHARKIPAHGPDLFPAFFLGFTARVLGFFPIIFRIDIWILILAPPNGPIAGIPKTLLFRPQIIALQNIGASPGQILQMLRGQVARIIGQIELKALIKSPVNTRPVHPDRQKHRREVLTLTELFRTLTPLPTNQKRIIFPKAHFFHPVRDIIIPVFRLDDF